MNKWKVNISIYAFIISTILIILSQGAFASDSAANLTDLESKVSNAMHTRVASYLINYTGDTSNIESDVKTIISNIYKADDYLHYSTKTYVFSASGLVNNLNITFTFTYWESLTQANFVSSTVDTVLSQIVTSGMNDYEKEKVIHDWIVTHVSYDSTLAQHSAYAALIAPYKTVCQGYALLAYKMLNKAGIQTIIAEGTGNNEAHAWVKVYLDGKWYQLDPTWDDPTTNDANNRSYDYYNLTDNEIKANHSWTLTYPTADTEFADVLNGKLTSDSAKAAAYQAIIDDVGLKYLSADYTVADTSGIVQKIQSAILSNLREIKVRYTSKSTVVADVKSAVGSITNITSYSYSYPDYVRTTQTNDVILNLTFVSTAPVSVDSISFSDAKLTLAMGASSKVIIPVISPTYASNKSVTWASSDTGIATVTAGIVKGIEDGTATITAKTVDGNKTATFEVTVATPATSIKLDRATLTLRIGDTDVKLNSAISPLGAKDKNLTWTSSNDSVATVSNDGTVKAITAGVAKITVKTSVGAKSAICTVTVPIPTTSVSFSVYEANLNIGKTLTVVPTVAPSNAKDKTVTWTSSDTSVATVSSKGVITGISEGRTEITAKTTDGGYTDTAYITVIRPVTGVTLDNKRLTIKVGADDVTLTPIIVPADASIKKITWTSSNPSIATVSTSGAVKAIAPGTTNITAKTVDGSKLATCSITIPTSVTGVSFAVYEASVKVGKTLTILPTIAPAKATTKTITWSSSDTSIATVSQKGLVTGIANGIAVITGTTTDGGFTDIEIVTVITPVVSVKLDNSTLTLKIGEAGVTLTPTITPITSTAKDVTWISSNTAVATVSNEGVVTAVAPGVSSITVKTVDGTKVAKCAVTVPTDVTGVTIMPETATLKIGGVLAVISTIAPVKASIKTVTWSSNDTSVATVSAKGVVTGVADGKATITVTTTDGEFKDSIEVTVVRPVTVSN